jgi:pyridoxine kinase
MKQKSVAAIHDIAGFGRCALTVVLPLLSACGVQTSAIPTALLSTCTGDFKGNTFQDLTNNIEPIAEHWQREQLKFDAIYTGYLCSAAQVYSVISAIEKIKSDDTLVIVDPVMGDNGNAYSGFPLSYPSYMLRLCQKADIITPNITEGALLTGMPYIESNYNEEYIETMLRKLYSLTKATVVLTGVSFDKKRIGAAIYEDGEISYVFAEKATKSFHSTGDIFASVLTGSIMNGRSLKSAAQIAVNFVSLCIRKTISDKADPRFGVNFETQIPELIKFLDL